MDMYRLTPECGAVPEPWKPCWTEDLVSDLIGFYRALYPSIKFGAVGGKQELQS